MLDLFIIQVSSIFTVIELTNKVVKKVMQIPSSFAFLFFDSEKTLRVVAEMSS